jgi:hypothetical protein
MPRVEARQSEVCGEPAQMLVDSKPEDAQRHRPTCTLEGADLKVGPYVGTAWRRGMTLPRQIAEVRFCPSGPIFMIWGRFLEQTPHFLQQQLALAVGRCPAPDVLEPTLYRG